LTPPPWARAIPPGAIEVETDDDSFLTVEAWPREVFRPHYHDRDFNWIVPMRPGRVVVRVEEREYSLDDNHWICVFPRTAHSVVHVSDDCEVLSLFVGSDAMERAWLPVTHPHTVGERCIVGGAGAVAQGLALAWGEYRFARREPDAVDSALERFVAGWLWRAYQPSPGEAADDWGMRLRIRLGPAGETVATFVDEHMADAPFPWDELAARLELSRRTLQRQFIEVLGQTMSDVLMAMRIARAKQLLVDPARSVGDVGIACGFSSQSHFSTAFKTATGVSPRIYRAELERRR
jgi:AraC-like DNA-binding protein